MNINATLLAQAVVFVIFVVICMKYVYPQILAVMQEREKRISDGLEAAKKADDSLEEAKLASDKELNKAKEEAADICLLYTSPSPRDRSLSRMPSSA